MDEKFKLEVELELELWPITVGPLECNQQKIQPITFQDTDASYSLFFS